MMSRSVRFFVPALLLMALLVPGTSAAAAMSPNALGKRLVRRYLSDVKRRDIGDLRHFLSPAFVVLRADGSRTTKRQFLRNPAKISSYKISGLRTTRDTNVLVVTYTVNVGNEVINGKRYPIGGPRLMTFMQKAGCWVATSLANFSLPAAQPA